MPGNPDPWLTTDDVAERYQRNESTIRYWRKIGYGPPGVRIGRRVYYRTSEVQKFEAELEQAQAVTP